MTLPDLCRDGRCPTCDETETAVSVQRYEMDPRSGKYAEPMPVDLAVTILSEMVDEWSWDDDPHGYCHQRRPIVALLNAYADHVAALAEAEDATAERLRWGYAKGRADALDEAATAVGNARMHNVADGLIAVAAIDGLRGQA